MPAKLKILLPAKCCPFAGIRHWADETASQHLFAGKDLLETNLFELSMEANSDAVQKLLEMKKTWDTVIVYPAFGNEVIESILFASQYLSCLLVTISNNIVRQQIVDHV